MNDELKNLFDKILNDESVKNIIDNISNNVKSEIYNKIYQTLQENSLTKPIDTDVVLVNASVVSEKIENIIIDYISKNDLKEHLEILSRMQTEIILNDNISSEKANDILELISEIKYLLIN